MITHATPTIPTKQTSTYGRPINRVKERQTLDAIVRVTPPGGVIPCRQLADELGLSRKAIHQRLNALRARGHHLPPDSRKANLRTLRKGYAVESGNACALPPITPNRLISHVKPSNHADPRPEPQPEPSVVWGREAPLAWTPALSPRDAAAYIYLEYQAVRRGSWKGTGTEDEGEDE